MSRSKLEDWPLSHAYDKIKYGLLGIGMSLDGQKADLVEVFETLAFLAKKEDPGWSKETSEIALLVAKHVRGYATHLAEIADGVEAIAQKASTTAPEYKSGSMAGRGKRK